eukprot:scaffold1627_cov126-Isochrysis_galbana.AAC.7
MIGSRRGLRTTNAPSRSCRTGTAWLAGELAGAGRATTWSMAGGRTIAGAEKRRIRVPNSCIGEGGCTA